MHNAQIDTESPATISTLRNAVAVCPLSPLRTDVLGMIDSLPTTITGATTMLGFFTIPAEQGWSIETVQLQWGRLWVPGPRKVTACRATFVELGGSRREYRGCRVIASDGARLVVATDDGVIAYVSR